MTGVVAAMHCVRASLKRDLCLKCQLLSFVCCHHLCIFTSISRQNQTVGGVENLLDIQVSVCYIVKHLENKKASYIRIYCTWCDIILIFRLHRRTRLTPRSTIHSPKIRMTSHPCNKCEQIMLSYLLSVKYNACRRKE